MGFVLVSMLSCTNDVLEMKQTDEASRIYLSAGIGEVVSSRTPYYPTSENNTVLTVPTTEHPLNVSVWATTDKTGIYSNDGLNGSNGTVAIHTQAHFQSGTPQLLGAAIYPKAPEENADPDPVFFVGFHPQSTTQQPWSATNENQSATFIFTGKEDVMFAPQISGVYETAFDNSPQFRFYHLLTWLRIEMVADKDENDILKKEAIAEAWGKIKSLTISSRKQVTVNSLGKTYTNADDMKKNIVDNLTFGGTESAMNFYHTGTDISFPKDTEGYPIPSALTEVAYVMCAPVEGEYQHTVDGVDVKKPEYTLHLQTEKRELDIPIDLKIAADDVVDSYFTGSTRGHQFKILLNFKMGNVISVSAEISLGANADWYTHGTGTGDIKEEDITNTGTE